MRKHGGAAGAAGILPFGFSWQPVWSAGGAGEFAEVFMHLRVAHADDRAIIGMVMPASGRKRPHQVHPLTACDGCDSQFKPMPDVDRMLW